MPVPEAVEIFGRGAERIVTVSDEEIAEAIRVYFRGTHNLSEGAGAASLAALMQECVLMQNRKVAVILSGGNIDTEWYLDVLGGGVPRI